MGDHIEVISVKSVTILKSIEITNGNFIIFFNRDDQKYTEPFNEFITEAKKNQAEFYPIAISIAHRAPPFLLENIQSFDIVEFELQMIDIGILEEFKSMFSVYSSIKTRERRTNYKYSYTSAALCIHDKAFRDELVDLGLPAGRKSNGISPPTTSYSKINYIRGLIDADGSLGLTSRGYPFISLVTASDAIKDEVI